MSSTGSRRYNKKKQEIQDMISLAVELQNQEFDRVHAEFDQNKKYKLYDHAMLQYVDQITGKDSYIEGKEELRNRKIITIPKDEPGNFKINMMDLRASMPVDQDPNEDPVDVISEQVGRAYLKNVLDPILESHGAIDESSEEEEKGSGSDSDEFDIVAQMEQVLAREEVERRAKGDIEMDEDHVMKAKIDPRLQELAQ